MLRLVSFKFYVYSTPPKTRSTKHTPFKLVSIMSFLQLAFLNKKVNKQLSNYLLGIELKRGFIYFQNEIDTTFKNHRITFTFAQ